MCVEESIKCHTLIPAYGVQTTKPVGSHRKAPSEKMVLSFFADSPENSLPRPARSA